MKVCVGKELRLKREWDALKLCSHQRNPVGGTQTIVDVSKRVSAAAAATAAVGDGSAPDLLFGAWSKSDNSLMVVGMELCLPLTLHDFLVYDTPQLPCALDLAYQVIKAVADVHKAGCVHRDIKLHNFVFDPKGRLRLVDFGLAYTDLNPPAGDLVAGTYAFMAPEMAYNVLSPKEDRLSVGVPADIWSVGAVLFCIYTRDDMYPVNYEDAGLTPSSPESQRKTQIQRNRALLVRVSRGRWKWPEDDATMMNIPPNIKTLIDNLLQLDLAERTHLDVILNDSSLWRGSVAASSGGRASMVDAHSDLREFLDVGLIEEDKDGQLAVEKSAVKKSPHGSRVSRTPLRVSTSSQAIPSLTSQMSAATSLASAAAPPQMSTPAPLQSSKPGSPLASSASHRAVSATRNLLNDDELLSDTAASPSPRNRQPATTTTTTRNNTKAPSSQSTMDALLFPHVPKVDVSKYKGMKLPKKAATALWDEQKVAREEVVALENKHILEIQQLFEAQSSNFKHPHRYKRYDRPVDSMYNDGAMCDDCSVFIAPRGRKKEMIFYHCSCGSDLCVGCHEAHEQRNTCDACSHISMNYQAFVKHSKSCKKRKTLMASPKAPLSRTPQVGGRRSRSAVPVDNSHHEAITEETTISELMAPQNHRGSSSGAGGGGRPSSRERSRSLNLNHTGSGTSPPQIMSVEELLQNPPAPLELNSVRSGEGSPQWQPFAKLKQRADETLSKLPTPQERDTLINSDWVRFYYYYPDDQNPGAFVYSVQPGRTGAIFLSDTAGLHSAVEAVVESKMFVVNSVDVSNPVGDDTRVISFTEAKASFPDLVQILLAALKRNSNLIKLKRSVGVMSVCQSQSRPISLVGAPFIFVRWVRVDSGNDITAFCLSNGFVQVFIGTDFEIRWMDLNRKFLIRANGTMELITDTDFQNMPGLVDLIYSPLD
eukprot:TRINITY_DN27022_c0_g1_i5.p1 TRINITY_DN27022_c0_g1~~TRINITY_DN27022_c0_g1_i5.p1  ORF type:complete len:935 (-),score=141.98 TRINITY_DN27022_c0_g1_i5:140-2944(-)